MIIRLFLMSWFISGSSVNTPLLQYIEEQEAVGGFVPQFEFIQNYYPTSALNGRPDKSIVLVMVKGSPEIEQFAAISGVYMLPPEQYSKPITKQMRNRFRNLSDSFGIPPALIDDAQTQGEAIDAVIRYLEPASSGLDKEFAADNDELFQ